LQAIDGIIKMNEILKIVLAVTLPFCSMVALAQTESEIIYEQKVARDDISIRQSLRGSGGAIYLWNDSVAFKANKEKNRRINFSVAYNDIKQVVRVNYLFFPNRILIRLKDGQKYRLFTYKRRTIIEEINRRLD
jgi:hypothetical protein